VQPLFIQQPQTKYNCTYLAIAILRYFSFTPVRDWGTLMVACSGRYIEWFAQGVRPMESVVRTCVRLQRVLRVASVVVPALAIAAVVVSGGHAQPDLFKWR